jgi:hypothetical protein
MCVLILLYMCPHTATHVSSDKHICVLILPYMCPHTAMYVSSYCNTCVLILRVKVSPGVCNSVQALLAPSSPAPSSPAPSAARDSAAAAEVLNLLALLVQKYKCWRRSCSGSVRRRLLQHLRRRERCSVLLTSRKVQTLTQELQGHAAAVSSTDIPCNTCDGENTCCAASDTE